MAGELHWPRLFVKVFGIGAVLILLVAVGVYEIRRQDEIETLRNEKTAILAAQTTFFLDVLHRLSADLTILADQTELTDPNPLALIDVAREYATMVNAVGNYRSIRLADAHGTELIRVVAEESGLVVTHVGAAEIPSLDARAIAALASAPHDAVMMLSDVDRRGGRSRPIWILAKPVPVDAIGPRYVVAAYRADLLFDRIVRFAHRIKSTLMLIGPDGTWTTETGQPVPDWTFSPPAADGPPLMQAYPVAWKRVLAEEAGTIPVRNGFFVFRTLHPAVKGFWGLTGVTANAGASSWTVAAFVSSEAIAAVENRILESLIPSVVALLLALGLCAWVASVYWTGYRRRQVRLVRQATTDALTGVLNRAAFEERFGAILARREETGGGCALIFVDLDSFKEINDVYGHDAGDACLRETAARIRSAIRETDLLGRLGGDEFAVVLWPITDRTPAEAVVEKIRGRLAAAPAFPGSGQPIRASLGLAVCPEDGTNAEMLLRTADQGMYGAKRKRRTTPA